jgi:hypothetical protein
MYTKYCGFYTCGMPASQPTLTVVVLCQKKKRNIFGRHCCTMKPCDILNVKNAPLESVHYVMEYTFYI